MYVHKHTQPAMKWAENLFVSKCQVCELMMFFIGEKIERDVYPGID